MGLERLCGRRVWRLEQVRSEYWRVVDQLLTSREVRSEYWRVIDQLLTNRGVQPSRAAAALRVSTASRALQCHYRATCSSLSVPRHVLFSVSTALRTL